MTQSLKELIERLKTRAETKSRIWTKSEGWHEKVSPLILEPDVVLRLLEALQESETALTMIAEADLPDGQWHADKARRSLDSIFGADVPAQEPR